MEKTFVHDCALCTFLGSVLVGVRRYDAYIHTAEPKSVIARFGDDAPDYMSIPLAMVEKRVKLGADDLPQPILEAWNLYNHK